MGDFKGRALYLASVVGFCVGAAFGQTEPNAVAPKDISNPPMFVAATCQELCSAQYDTCMSGCRNISDADSAASCVRGCMRGYESCKGRCGSSYQSSKQSDANPSKPLLIAKECFATCTYRDSQGSKFLGISSGGCDSACSAASAKCSSESKSGGCSYLQCSATDC